jgi:DNA-binding transcriptional MerR regulator
MTAVTEELRGHGGEPRLRTIGSVCEELREEFPDISVSKIRYLEDQGLLRPRRTRGGYRLFATEDVDRLTTILRLQRDEFLPLYGESEADIVAACARLARFGVDARHLRTFVTAAGRQSTLVEQLVAPGLRSRNADRRKGALEDIEALARVAHELSHLLLLRNLRATVERSA